MMLKHHATRHLLPPLSQPHQWDLSFPGKRRRALGRAGHAAGLTAEQVIHVCYGSKPFLLQCIQSLSK